MGGTMIFRRTIIFICISWFTIASVDSLNFDGIRSYAKYVDWGTLGDYTSGNELWNGIINDCSKNMRFSCIQKNAYTYLNNTFVERDNITVFGGFVLRRNDLDFETMRIKSNVKHNVDENLVDNSNSDEDAKLRKDNESQPRIPDVNVDEEELLAEHREEYKKSPLEEITHALHDKTIKFLATRNYELQLPEFFFEGSTVKISPRQIDNKGALIRIDFGQRVLENQGRLFKKLKKFIANKLLVSFLALILIIKLIKVKFLFVIPFLFGVGTAKKLFLKLLLFVVPAFGQVFKLCSSYYSSKAAKYHHHHHQIAHHHHHVPVPVPVPAYFEPNHHSHHGEVSEGYDYPPPWAKLHREAEELREWGIEPTEEIIYEDPGYQQFSDRPPCLSVDSGNSLPCHPSNQSPRPPGPIGYQDNFSGSPGSHGQHLAFNGYADEHNKFSSRVSVQSPMASPPRSHVSQVVAGPVNIQVPSSNSINLPTPNGIPHFVGPYVKTLHNGFGQRNSNVPNQPNVQDTSRPNQHIQTRRVLVQQPVKTSVNVASHLTQSNNPVATYDDVFYGPIVETLEDIFTRLRFNEESCRERLVCSMYKNPELYTPHSNLVSNELSRDPEELVHGDIRSNSGQRFHQYLNAARLGQNGDDCLRKYPCHIKTE